MVACKEDDLITGFHNRGILYLEEIMKKVTTGIGDLLVITVGKVIIKWGTADMKTKYNVMNFLLMVIRRNFVLTTGDRKKAKKT